MLTEQAIYSISP